MNGRSRRVLALLLATVWCAQAAGPALAAPKAPAGAHAEHGASGEHHPGCPWRGVGPCPHAHGASHGEAGWTACGDDLAAALDGLGPILPAPPASRGGAPSPPHTTRPPTPVPPASPTPPRSPDPPPPRPALDR